MPITIDISLKGAGTTINYLQKINKTIPIGATNVMERYGRFVNRSAKAHASGTHRWAASGSLSKSIKITREGKNRLTISANSRAAKFQELGYKPHYVPIMALSKRVRDSMEQYSRGSPDKVSSNGKKGFIFVTKSKPFFSPAIKKANTKIDGWINDELNKALK